MAARSMGCRRSRSGTKCSSGRSGSASSARDRDGETVTAAPTATRLRATGREVSRFRIQPRFRGRELTLLGLVALALFLGAASLGATEQLHNAQLNGDPLRLDLLAPYDPSLL